MALIKCPECKKEVSEQAEKCIYCGYPIYIYTKTPKKYITCTYCFAKQEDPLIKKLKIAGIVFAGIFLWSMILSNVETDPLETEMGSELLTEISTEIQEVE